MIQNRKTYQNTHSSAAEDCHINNNSTNNQ